MVWTTIAASVGSQLLGGALGKSGLLGDFGGGAAQQAVNKAADLAKDVRFKGYTVDTSGGSAYADPQEGIYGYDLSPAYSRVSDAALGGAGGLFERLQGFDPNVRASELFSEKITRLVPQMEQFGTQLQQGLFGSGTLLKRMAGESQGLGVGSGLVNVGQLTGQRAINEALMTAEAESRKEALQEGGQLLEMAQGMLNAGLSISDLERQFINLGIDAETARSAAQYAAGQLEMSPYEYLFKSAVNKSKGIADFGGGLSTAIIKKL